MPTIEALRGEQSTIKWDFISTFSNKHGGIVGESLGSEALAGHLIGENGERVKVDHFDMQLDPLEKIMLNVFSHKPHIIGLSVKIGATGQTDQIIVAINNLPWEDGGKPLLVLGGVVPTFAPTELLRRYPQAILSTGEGEIASQMIVEAIRGDRLFEEIPGITFINGEGKIVANRPKLWPLNKLHYPARITTRRINNELRGMVWVEDSRGCDYTCTFCSRRALRGSGFSGELSPQHVAEDLESLNKMGINQLSFSGDDFCGDPERAYAIADEIIRRNIQMDWSISTRVDHIFERENTPEQNARLREIIKHCKEAGLTCVFIGLESGSKSQLKRYGKQITVEENYRAIEILRELGISIVAGYIPIDYLMTVTELRETLEFLKQTRMGENVSNLLSTLRVQAGSPYFDLVKHKGLLDGPTEDLVFYKARFKDPRVELVAQIANEWIEDLYPLTFGLKSEIVAMALIKEKQDTPVRNIEFVLHSLRRLELDFFISLVCELEKGEHIDHSDVNAIKVIFYRKRRRLLGWVKSKLLSGSFGDVNTSRLLVCLDETPL